MTVIENSRSASAAPTTWPTPRNSQPSGVVRTIGEEFIERREGQPPEEQGDHQPDLVHPDPEEEEHGEGHPGEFAQALRPHHRQDCAPGERRAAFQPAAHLVEPGRREGADQRETDGEGIDHPRHVPAREGERDDHPDGRKDAAEHETETRRGGKVSHALDEAGANVGHAERHDLRPRCNALRRGRYGHSLVVHDAASSSRPPDEGSTAPIAHWCRAECSALTEINARERSRSICPACHFPLRGRAHSTPRGRS